MSEEVTEKEPQPSEANEGAVTSTEDNEAPEYEPLPPITVAERDRVLSRPLVAPSDESRVAAKKEADDKPAGGEEVQEALDAEAEKKAEKEAKDEEELSV